jgi:DNA segregation ATPase FtsK/SpoIIIE-like protein
MPTGTPRDPLHYQARQHMLHANDTSVALLQRHLRIGHQHAIALREALAGDAVEYRAETDSWHIRPDADRATDFLLQDKLARAAHLVQNAKALVIAAGAGIHNPDDIELALGTRDALERIDGYLMKEKA